MQQIIKHQNVSRWKDKWFYYKLISALLILFFLFSVYLSHLLTRTWLRNANYEFSSILFQGQFLSFFTYQTNFIVAVWFLIAAIYHQKANRIVDNQNVRIAITSYISITGFIWTFIIFPILLIAKRPGILELTGGIFFHIITPVLMIFYTFQFKEPFKKNLRSYFKKTFWLYLIYPVVYTIYLILRIVFYTTDARFQGIPVVIIFPYALVFSTDPTNLEEIITQAYYLILGAGVFFIVVYVSIFWINITYVLVFNKMTKSKTEKNFERKKKKLGEKNKRVAS